MRAKTRNPLERETIATNSQFPATALKEDVDSEESPQDLAALPDLVISPDRAHGVTSDLDRLALSVIIAVRNDPANLELCLQALRASEYADYEIIVVDDASTGAYVDATSEVADRHGVQLLRQDTRTGPAGARNRGARVARHPCLFFVDADVCVQPGTLGQVAAKFESSPAVVAFFGSYDASPGAPNVMSQYRNLLHHYVHQTGNSNAFSFWSGCGAVKKSVFLELGGFDVNYDNASIEDIELGARLREAGHRIELVKSIQVKHLKRWTLWQMIRTDVRDRALPWTRLVLRQGKIPNDLNLRYSQRLSALLAAGLLVTLGLGSWYYPGMLLIPLMTLVILLSIDRWTTRRPVPTWARVATSLMIAAVAALTLATTAWSLLALGFLLGIVLLNGRFYAFLFRVKHTLFVLLVLPLHVLYYLYSSLAFAVGLMLHLGGATKRNP